jgi:hypothetical protein
VNAIVFAPRTALQVTPMIILKPLLWLLVMAVGGISPLAATSVNDFSNYRWKHRLLFIFAPSTTDATFLALDKHLAQSAPEIEDRDMIIFRIFKNSPSRLADRPLQSVEAEALRRRFGIAADKFTVVLVGKDGGVKWVAHRDVDLHSIFNLIDSMPMRRQEMRDNPSSR